MPFQFSKLEIPEVIKVEPKLFGDARGFFMETYKTTEFREFGITDDFNQDNHSRSVKGVLRGLHYQKQPKPQSKLVRCIKGEILDIAVDIRKGSPTYGKWVGEILSEENRTMLYVPVGFAHGFLVISDIAEVIYKTCGEYSPENEAGVIWNDPDIAIKWGIEKPLVSDKDKILPQLRNADNNFRF